jgi:hypothetical protein
MIKKIVVFCAVIPSAMHGMAPDSFKEYAESSPLEEAATAITADRKKDREKDFNLQEQVVHEQDYAVVFRSWDKAQKKLTAKKNPKASPQFSQTARELTAATISENPEAQTKIAVQIQAAQAKLNQTTNPKKRAAIEDELKWFNALKTINARAAKNKK